MATVRIYKVTTINADQQEDGYSLSPAGNNNLSYGSSDGGYNYHLPEGYKLEGKMIFDANNTYAHILSHEGQPAFCVGGQYLPLTKVNSDWDWYAQDGDSETYKVNNHDVKVSWGYATGSELGQHNAYDSFILIELDGESYAGFNIESGREGWDDEFTAEYLQKLNIILEQISKLEY